MKVWVDHMVDHFSTYIYQKRGFYYFSRRVPKDVQPLQWLYILRHTPGEVVKATLLVNIRAEMVYHMVYPHLHRNNNNASITAC